MIDFRDVYIDKIINKHFKTDLTKRKISNRLSLEMQKKYILFIGSTIIYSCHTSKHSLCDSG